MKLYFNSVCAGVLLANVGFFIIESNRVYAPKDTFADGAKVMKRDFIDKAGKHVSDTVVIFPLNTRFIEKDIKRLIEEKKLTVEP